MKCWPPEYARYETWACRKFAFCFVSMMNFELNLLFLVAGLSLLWWSRTHTHTHTHTEPHLISSAVVLCRVYVVCQ